MASQKINITLQKDLLVRADDYAADNGMTRSGLISVALAQYLNAVAVQPSINKILASMAAVAEGAMSGEMSPAIAAAKMEAIQQTYEDIMAKNK